MNEFGLQPGNYISRPCQAFSLTNSNPFRQSYIISHYKRISFFKELFIYIFFIFSCQIRQATLLNVATLVAA